MSGFPIVAEEKVCVGIPGGELQEPGVPQGVSRAGGPSRSSKEGREFGEMPSRTCRGGGQRKVGLHPRGFQVDVLCMYSEYNIINSNDVSLRSLLYSRLAIAVRQDRAYY